MNSLVVVDSFDTSSQAAMAVFLLEAEGIWCSLADETLVSMDWFMSNAVGGIKLQVRREDTEKAVKILENFRREQQERKERDQDTWIAFVCTRCKKPIAVSGALKGRVDSCPLCGKHVDVPESHDTALSSDEVQAAIELFRSGQLPFHNLQDSLLYLSLEVGVLLFFAYLPYLVPALQNWLTTPEGMTLSWNLDENPILFYSLRNILILCAVVAISRTSFEQFGLTARFWQRDLLMSFPIAILYLAIHWLASNILPAIPTEYYGWNSTVPWHVWFISGLIANSIAEEWMMRSYLIDRFQRFGLKPWLAVVMAASLFGSYHLYQGFAGAVSATLMGLIFGAWFVKTRRILGPILAHTWANLLFFYPDYYNTYL